MMEIILPIIMGLFSPEKINHSIKVNIREDDKLNTEEEIPGDNFPCIVQKY